jgi:hypothetical protein
MAITAAKVNRGVHHYSQQHHVVGVTAVGSAELARFALFVGMLATSSPWSDLSRIEYYVARMGDSGAPGVIDFLRHQLF